MCEICGLFLKVTVYKSTITNIGDMYIFFLIIALAYGKVWCSAQCLVLDWPYSKSESD